ncbi:hypothetical protein GCM10010398_61150 [Streptomyces fimbriatus]
MHEDGLKSPAAQVTGVESPFGTGGHLPGSTEALSAPLAVRHSSAAVRRAAADLPAVVEVFRLPVRQGARVGALLDELEQWLGARARALSR